MQPFIFAVYLMNHVFQTSVPLIRDNGSLWVSLSKRACGKDRCSNEMVKIYFWDIVKSCKNYEKSRFWSIFWKIFITNGGGSFLLLVMVYNEIPLHFCLVPAFNICSRLIVQFDFQNLIKKSNWAVSSSQVKQRVLTKYLQKLKLRRRAFANASLHYSCLLG